MYAGLGTQAIVVHWQAQQRARALKTLQSKMQPLDDAVSSLNSLNIKYLTFKSKTVNI